MTAEASHYAGFVRQNTSISQSSLVPSIRLFLGSTVTPLWAATEDYLNAHNIPPPFWAFAWPGAEALARHITDHPELVRGRSVLDFAAGCGLAGLACARAGAQVDACETDPFAVAAIILNSTHNKLILNVIHDDLVGTECRWDVILCGDVCYEASMTAHILPWLRNCARQALVIIADPGRKYAPVEGVEVMARYVVPTSLELEERASREVTLFRLLPD